MLVELKKDFFFNVNYIVSVEIVINQLDQSDQSTVIIKTTSNNHGSKGVLDLEFDDYQSAKDLIDKIKKAIKKSS